MYWRGPEQWRFHYRNDGPVKIEKLYSPYYLRELLGDTYTITYAVEEDRTMTITAKLVDVVMDSDGEWLNVEHEQHIRIDKILDIKKETD